MITIMDGKSLAHKLNESTKKLIEVNDIHPVLAVVQIGDDKASSIYVRNKSKACEQVGIKFSDYHLSENTNWVQACALIEQLNEDDNIDGILIQQPVPKVLQGIEQLVNTDKDVDGFTYENLGRLLVGDTSFIPCTTLGILELFKEYNIDIAGKHIVVVGRSKIVGKPTAVQALEEDATITVCHSKTKNLMEITKSADILIVAVGKSKMINHNYISLKCECIIDVGINRDKNNKLYGDCDFNDIVDWWNGSQLHENRYITPVPGGVGPLTIACLMKNVADATIKNKYFN